MSRQPRDLTPDRVRQHRALQARLLGLNYDQVAIAAGYSSKGGAYRAVQRILNRQESEGASSLRDLEGARLDALQAAIWRQALQGDLAAIDRVVRISARRAALYGLDAPAQVTVRTAGPEIADLREQFERMAGLTPTLPELGDIEQ